jgi:hypothetical protein
MSAFSVPLPSFPGVSESLCFGSLVMFGLGLFFLLSACAQSKKSRPELDRKLVGCGFPVQRRGLPLGVDVAQGQIQQLARCLIAGEVVSRGGEIRPARYS